MKLAFFDFDSTLIDGETLEILASEFGLGSKIKEITDKAMNGELDFFESLTTRVALLKGLPAAKINESCANLPVTKGAKEAVSGLKKRGYKVICLSGGFQNATGPICEKLGLDADFSNILHEKDGLLTGLVGGEMMFSESKGRIIKKLQKLTDTSANDTIAIGDGANDLSSFEHAGQRIAFCAKPILKQAANIIIDEKDLSLILDKIKD